MTDQRQAARELAAEFRALSASIGVTADPVASLDRVAVLATRNIPGCQWCAITQAGVTPRTLAASDDTARAIDAAQLAADDGPCLSAARDDTVVYVADLREEQRWPAFTRRALATTPLRSVLTFQLDPDGARSALNLYSGRVGAFGPESLATATLFASLAQTAVIHVDTRTKSLNLERALAGSRLIGAAVGIMMSTHKITEDDAFQMLRRSSQALNRKLADIAYEVTETGTLP